MHTYTKLHVHAYSSTQSLCKVMHTNEHMLLFNGSDVWRQREGSSLKRSIAGSDPLLSFLVLVMLPVPPVWTPPTHPSVPIGPLRPRVHLAPSSVSVELSPTMATTECPNMPTVLFKGYEVTGGKKEPSSASAGRFTLQIFIHI